MKNFDELVATAGRQLPSRWLSLWDEVEVEYVNRFGPVAIELDRSGEKKINVYRNIMHQEGHKNAVELLLIEFFKLVEYQLDEPLSRRFTYKFVLAPEDAVTGFNERLKTGTFKTYKSLVEDFGNAISRLTALHIGNALITNQLPIGEARDINVREWAATKDFASRKRYMSLTPLISAYSSREIDEDFPCAAAAYICNGLDAVSEESTKKAYVQLLKEIIG